MKVKRKLLTILGGFAIWKYGWPWAQRKRQERQGSGPAPEPPPTPTGLPGA